MAVRGSCVDNRTAGRLCVWSIVRTETLQKSAALKFGGICTVNLPWHFHYWNLKQLVYYGNKNTRTRMRRCRRYKQSVIILSLWRKTAIYGSGQLRYLWRGVDLTVKKNLKHTVPTITGELLSGGFVKDLSWPWKTFLWLGCTFVIEPDLISSFSPLNNFICSVRCFFFFKHRWDTRYIQVKFIYPKTLKIFNLSLLFLNVFNQW